jgi:manganese/zinc/iron transport system permease protein
MLILPGATAQLLSTRLPLVMVLSVVNAALCSVLGYHLGMWMRCSIAGAMVVMAAGLFLLAWIFSPEQGLLQRWRRSRRVEEESIESLPVSNG